MREPEGRPWGLREFYVEDGDGYVLCFAEACETARRDRESEAE